MSWHYLPELVGDSLEQGCWGGRPSVPWKKSRTAERCCSDDNGTVCSPCSRSGTTYEHLREIPGVDTWMSSLRVSRVSRSASQESSKEKTTSATSGPIPSGSFARWDRDFACWKTFQVSLLTNTLEPFSGSWPRAGTVFDGIAYQRAPAAPLTRGTGSGLWATPNAADCQGTTGGGQGRNLRTDVRWTTPCADDTGARQKKYSQGGKALSMQAGGQLNPPWVEWLMGWPIGWSALEPLETDKFQQWLEQHGSF